MKRRRRLRIAGRWLRTIADTLDPRPYYTLQVATAERTDTFINCVPFVDLGQ